MYKEIQVPKETVVEIYQTILDQLEELKDAAKERIQKQKTAFTEFKKTENERKELRKKYHPELRAKESNYWGKYLEIEAELSSYRNPGVELKERSLQAIQGAKLGDSLTMTQDQVKQMDWDRMCGIESLKKWIDSEPYVPKSAYREWEYNPKPKKVEYVEKVIPKEIPKECTGGDFWKAFLVTGALILVAIIVIF